jgi:hypothetical protein
MLATMNNMIRTASVVAVAAITLGVTAGCNGAKSSCRGNTCNVTVTGDEDVKATILNAKWEFDAVVDDSIEVEVNRQEKVIREGETATVGNFTVQVTDADKGKAKLVIRR